MSLDRSEIDRCLTIIRSIGAEHRLTDFHVHPFEVVFGAGQYAVNRHITGIWSTTDLPYVPPVVSEIEPAPHSAPASDLPEVIQKKFARSKLGRLYVHSGPRCFSDHMQLAGLSRTVLLPVSRPGADVDTEMSTLQRMFGDDSRFVLAYSVPVETPTEEIDATLRRAIRQWNVRLVKVYPSLSGIDLNASSGRSRIETILEASGKAELPAIIHAGGPPNGNGSSGQYSGFLEYVAHLNFRVTAHPVVIAHAGCFGLEPQQVMRDVIPLLKDLLWRNDHLYVDISALPAEVLQLVISNIDPRRILFGSDALYEAPWKSIVKLFVALERAVSGRAEELLVCIASTNSDLMLGNGTVGK